MGRVLTEQDALKLDAYFRATNYLSVGQLYLLDNPLLKRPLEKSDIKRKIVGHWGTIPGQTFIYTHLNRIIKEHDLNMIYVSGPGHGGNAIVSHVYLEGSYTETYPDITQDEEGMKKLFKQFSFPGGISSHVAPETPGSINEGGELGYSLAHSYGAVLDNPDLIVACVVGDGEAETGPLATSWQLNKFINPKTDGVVLPILHLNGYKISNPTVFSRISEQELKFFFYGCGYRPIIVEVDDSLNIYDRHERMAKALEECVEMIKEIKQDAIERNNQNRPLWPMIILKTPKGWTGPEIVDGEQIEGTFRAHQVPIVITEDSHVRQLEDWMRSYKPEELFNVDGTLKDELKELCPTGKRRMGSNPIANGGLLLKELRVPNFKEYGVKVDFPGSVEAQDMMELGKFVRDIIKYNEPNRNFRVFGPDEAMSNRLKYVFEETNRQFTGSKLANDEFISSDGRVIDTMLSEHTCEGMLEGYLLTGRHGFFNSYEAFIRVVDSMTSQHAKWLKVTSELPWRQKIASLNYVLTSHVWQQDHNGYTHQDPGFLNHLVTKKSDVVRMYLPPDTNCLLSCFDHCIRSKNYINVMVASKHPRPQWLTMKQAVKHCTNGIGIWDWASNDQNIEPDLVMACAGDTPTLEALAATSILRENFPEIKIRFVNVVDLMRLESNTKHPHGLTDLDYNSIFTKDKPIIFAFHGYASLIHQLVYNRDNENIHVHGYQEEGTITTPFDMRVQNKMDRFNLVIDALKYLPQLGNRGSRLIQWCKDKLVEHKHYIKEYGEDLPEVKDWKWQKK